MKPNLRQITQSILIGLIFLLPLCILIPSINQVPFPSLSQYSDLVISHIPNILEIVHSLSEYHQIPLWSNSIMSGYPLVSDPLSSIWYPPLWIAWILPLPFSINLLVVLHLFLAEMGMYLFLRKKGMAPLAGIMGGLLVGLAPKVWGHFGAGHITLIFAYAWTPWLLLFMALQRAQGGFKRLSPGIILACIILADIRWFVFAFLIFISYELFLTLTLPGRFSTKHKWLEWIKIVLENGLAAGILCLPYLLLLFQFSGLSTRSLMTALDQVALALPPEALLGFLFPNMAGYAEWITYVGAFSLLIVLDVLFAKRNKEIFFWFLILIFSLIFATGSEWLGYLLKIIPEMNLFRIPSRALFVSIFSVGILVAYGSDLIIKSSKENRIPHAFWLNLLTFGLGVSALFMMAGMILVNKSNPIKFEWGAVSYGLFFILLMGRDRNLINGKTWGILMVPLLVVDLLTVGISQIRFENFENVMNQGGQIAELIQKDGQIGRIYTPSYSIPQQTANQFRLEMVNGIDPLQIKSYADYISNATGVPDTVYSVTIPPFASADLANDNRDAIPNMNLLGRLNVAYIVSEFDMGQNQLKKIGQVGTTRIYLNPDVQPRAKLIEAGQNEAIKINLRRPGYYELIGQGPGKLVLSDVYYPGWKVIVDGTVSSLEIYDSIFPSVQIGTGLHHVQFVFSPDILLIGMVVSLIITVIYVGVKIVHP